MDKANGPSCSSSVCFFLVSLITVYGLLDLCARVMLFVYLFLRRPWFAGCRVCCCSCSWLLRSLARFLCRALVVVGLGVPGRVLLSFLASLLRSPCAVCDRAVSFGPFRRFVSLLSAVRLFVHCIHTDSLLQYMLLVCGLWPFGQPRTHTLQRSGAFAPSLCYTLGYPSIHPFIDKQTEHSQVPLKISTAVGAWG